MSNTMLVLVLIGLLFIIIAAVAIVIVLAFKTKRKKKPSQVAKENDELKKNAFTDRFFLNWFSWIIDFRKYLLIHAPYLWCMYC